MILQQSFFLLSLFYPTNWISVDLSNPNNLPASNLRCMSPHSPHVLHLRSSPHHHLVRPGPSSSRLGHGVVPRRGQGPTQVDDLRSTERSRRAIFRFAGSWMFYVRPQHCLRELGGPGKDTFFLSPIGSSVVGRIEDLFKLKSQYLSNYSQDVRNFLT